MFYRKSPVRGRLGAVLAAAVIMVSGTESGEGIRMVEAAQETEYADVSEYGTRG